MLLLAPFGRSAAITLTVTVTVFFHVDIRNSRKYDTFRGKRAVLFINLLGKGLTPEINGDRGFNWWAPVFSDVFKKIIFIISLEKVVFNQPILSPYIRYPCPPTSRLDWKFVATYTRVKASSRGLRWPGACFSKYPEIFQARRQILKSKPAEYYEPSS